MKVVGIIQARMGSRRLPGKMLMDVGGHPLMDHAIARLRSARTVDAVVIATTDSPLDDPIAERSEHLGIPVFRGSEADVLDRYTQAARLYEADAIIRVTGDCPLLDPKEVDRAVRTFTDDVSLEYVALGYSYPEGFGVEVVSRNALESAWREASDPSDREHVTPFVQRHKDRFKAGWVEWPEDLSRFRVTVDEERDLRVVSEVLDALTPEDPMPGLGKVVEFLKAHPDVAMANRDAIRSSGWKNIARSSAEEGL
jgi:spore coat polysaccharide biosynthesis protein SpsF